MNRSNAQMGFIGVYLILKGWHLRINKRRLYSKVHQLSSSTNLSLHEHEYGSSASCFNLCTKISDLSTLFKPLRSKILQLLLERGIVLQNYPIFGQTYFATTNPLHAHRLHRGGRLLHLCWHWQLCWGGPYCWRIFKREGSMVPNLYNLNEKYRNPPYFIEFHSTYV